MEETQGWVSISDTSQDLSSGLLSTGDRAVGSTSDSKWGEVTRAGQRIEGAFNKLEDCELNVRHLTEFCKLLPIEY